MFLAWVRMGAADRWNVKENKGKKLKKTSFFFLTCSATPAGATGNIRSSALSLVWTFKNRFTVYCTTKSINNPPSL